MDALAAGAADRPSTADSYPLATQLRDAFSGPERIGTIGAAVCLGLLAILFLPTLSHFVSTWSSDENYSHGFLVPVIALYLANEAARRGPIAVRGGRTIGIALLVLAIFGRLVTAIVPVGIVSDLAFLLGLAGVIALMAGTRALRRYWFALGFLVFMVPLPIALYSAIASPLQLLVSRLGGAALTLGGIPVLVQGNMMTLPGGVQMFVAEACSGMRQLTGFLALTTAVAYLLERPAWYRIVLIASAVPIALAANVLRVVVTGMIMYHLNPELAMGKFHTIEGLLMMGVGLALLAAECVVLNSLAPNRPGSSEGRAH